MEEDKKTISDPNGTHIMPNVGFTLPYPDYSSMGAELDKRISLQELTITNIMEKLDDILKRFDKFEEKLDSALDKKANIWVEKVLIWIGGLVATGILTYLGWLIIKLISL